MAIRRLRYEVLRCVEGKGIGVCGRVNNIHSPPLSLLLFSLPTPTASFLGPRSLLISYSLGLRLSSSLSHTPQPVIGLTAGHLPCTPNSKHRTDHRRGISDGSLSERMKEGERERALRRQCSQTHKIANDRSDRGNNTGRGFGSEDMATITPASSLPWAAACRESPLLRTGPQGSSVAVPLLLNGSGAPHGSICSVHVL